MNFIDLIFFMLCFISYFYVMSTVFGVFWTRLWPSIRYRLIIIVITFSGRKRRTQYIILSENYPFCKMKITNISIIISLSIKTPRFFAQSFFVESTLFIHIFVSKKDVFYFLGPEVIITALSRITKYMVKRTFHRLEPWGAPEYILQNSKAFPLEVDQWPSNYHLQYIEEQSYSDASCQCQIIL